MEFTVDAMECETKLVRSEEGVQRNTSSTLARRTRSRVATFTVRDLPLIEQKASIEIVTTYRINATSV